MAHFAKINENNIVEQVIVVEDKNCLNQYDQESEEIGSLFCHTLLGGIWVQTSYNTQGNTHILGGVPFRKNYASIGYTYDKERNAFIPPQPFNSWVLDENTCLWKSPIPYPEDGKKYNWNEESINWVEIV
jgi:hypothetical protein